MSSLFNWVIFCECWLFEDMVAHEGFALRQFHHMEAISHLIF